MRNKDEDEEEQRGGGVEHRNRKAVKNGRSRLARAMQRRKVFTLSPRSKCREGPSETFAGSSSEGLFQIAFRPSNSSDAWLQKCGTSVIARGEFESTPPKSHAELLFFVECTGDACVFRTLARHASRFEDKFVAGTSYTHPSGRLHTAGVRHRLSFMSVDTMAYPRQFYLDRGYTTGKRTDGPWEFFRVDLHPYESEALYSRLYNTCIQMAIRSAYRSNLRFYRRAVRFLTSAAGEKIAREMEKEAPDVEDHEALVYFACREVRAYFLDVFTDSDDCTEYERFESRVGHTAKLLKASQTLDSVFYLSLNLYRLEEGSCLYPPVVLKAERTGACARLAHAVRSCFDCTSEAIFPLTEAVRYFCYCFCSPCQPETQYQQLQTTADGERVPDSPGGCHSFCIGWACYRCCGQNGPCSSCNDHNQIDYNNRGFYINTSGLTPKCCSRQYAAGYPSGHRLLCGSCYATHRECFFKRPSGFQRNHFLKDPFEIKEPRERKRQLAIKVEKVPARPGEETEEEEEESQGLLLGSGVSPKATTLPTLREVEKTYPEPEISNWRREDAEGFRQWFLAQPVHCSEMIMALLYYSGLASNWVMDDPMYVTPTRLYEIVSRGGVRGKVKRITIRAHGAVDKRVCSEGNSAPPKEYAAGFGHYG